MKNSLIFITGLTLCFTFLSPTSFIMFTGLFTTALFSGIAYFISTGWISSKPNEWLLIIENGRLKKAGVGLKTFKWMNQTAVTFPSTIQGVSFQAAQVTKENFGIEIEGIVFWAVNRDGDGPFKCYKYTEGSNANENVKQVTESIVRSQISNTTLINVLRKRVDLREQVKKQLVAQLEGWGIWPETVEITEVRICSNQTFKDMQTEFRFEHKQKAQKAKQETNKILEEEKNKYMLQLQQIQNDLSTDFSKFKQDQQIKREEYKTKFEKEKVEFDKQQLEQQKEISLLQQDLANSKQVLNQENTLFIENLDHDLQMKLQKKKQDIENKMNDRNLEILKLKSTTDTYRKMDKLYNVKVNRFNGPDSFSKLASSMPAMNLMNEALKQ